MENNAKQAMFPQGAEVIPNPVGTAAGFVLPVQEKLDFCHSRCSVRNETGCCPKALFPFCTGISRRSVRHSIKQTIKTFGLGEAAVDERLADIDFNALGVSVGFYPVFPENHLVLIARSESQEQAQKNLQKAHG
ncbi:MAG: hypothetical protein MZV70_36705 [Desulfobacterales bacterium]|nr:hypothetical protein [Desulfobacterales bacterium]